MIAEFKSWIRLLAERWRLRVALDALLCTMVRLLLCLLPSARRNQPVRRSLWAGTPIITLSLKARAERHLGIEAHSLVFHTYFVTNQFDYDLSRWTRGRIGALLLPYAVFVWACVRYQRFHFFYDSGLLPQLDRFTFNRRELQMLRWLGKEVYFWAYGADVRTRKKTLQLGEFHCCTDCPAPGKSCVCDDETGRRNFERIRQHATAVFAMGDMVEYTPGSRNDLFHWPIDLQANNGERFQAFYPDPFATQPIIIVHAPNHREFKGTQYFLSAIEQLRGEGHQIDLRLVEKVPNSHALELYRSADLIFDQCLIGFHGYFALEAMALGKPVLTYIRDRASLLAPDECPLLSATPHELADVLRGLLGDRARLHRLGVAGRKYIERYYSLEAFAGRLGRAIDEVAA